MLNLKYRDKLRQILTNSQEEHWRLERMTKCAHRILTAVSFREMSKSALDKTGSMLLPAIGLYYAIFHLSIAVLCIDYQTKLKDLKNLKHKKLQNFIQNRLMNRKLLSEKYSELLHKLKFFREYGNYKFGIGFMENSNDNDEFPRYYEFKDIVPNLYDETGKAFDEALRLIKNICDEIEKILNISHFFLAAHIGDGIGDDLYSNYLSDEDERKVIEYLISKNLTT